MPIPVIKYKVIYDNFLDWLHKNCVNYYNFDEIDACFKYPYHTDIYMSGTWQYSWHRYCTLTANAIPKATDLDSTYSNFIKTYFTDKGFNLTDNATANGMIYFLNVLATFAIKHCQYSTSILSQSNIYLVFVYKDNPATLTSYFNSDNLIHWDDNIELITNLSNYIKNQLKIIPVQYTFDMHY